jgi:hypothetical protein
MNLTQEQIENIQIDYGIIFINYGEAGERLLGPTRGGGTFTVEKSIRDIEFDGRKGKTKGMQVLDELNAKLSTPLLDMSLDTLSMVMPYATYADGKISAKSENFGRLPTGAYLKNIALLARTVGGSYKLIKLYNAMSESDFSFTAAPKGEGVVQLEVYAHWDAENDTADLYDIQDVESLTNDTTPPTATTIPADAATSVSVSANLSAQFSEPIRDVDINTNNFILIKASDGSVVPGSISYNAGNRTAIFDPTSNLDSNTDYIWTIARVRDLAGNVMAPKVVNFKTA